MARPRTSDSKRKSARIAFRLTPTEFCKLCDTANTAGMSPNVFARSLALRHGKLLIVRKTTDADPALLKRLERIGTNLNQLVRYAHITGIVNEKIEPLCDEIAEIVYRDIGDF